MLCGSVLAASALLVLGWTLWFFFQLLFCTGWGFIFGL
jgi:hypothetical protein